MNYKILAVRNRPKTREKESVNRGLMMWSVLVLALSFFSLKTGRSIYEMKQGAIQAMDKLRGRYGNEPYATDTWGGVDDDFDLSVWEDRVPDEPPAQSRTIEPKTNLEYLLKTLKKMKLIPEAFNPQNEPLVEVEAAMNEKFEQASQLTDPNALDQLLAEGKLKSGTVVTVCVIDIESNKPVILEMGIVQVKKRRHVINRFSEVRGRVISESGTRFYRTSVPAEYLSGLQELAARSPERAAPFTPIINIIRLRNPSVLHVH